MLAAAWSTALSNSARPSPCATATGRREPAMPRSRIDGDSITSSNAVRASNCSLRLRRNFGQCSAPGMMSLSWLIIWQPLHTPSAKVSGRAKNAANASRSAGRSRMDVAQPRPAPSTSP
ncbi:hypothetical protein D3C81_1240030 [compost metagenome]